MHKFLFLTLVCLLGFACFAQDWPIKGSFQFSGDIKLIQTRVTEIVQLRAPKAHARIQELSDLGYQCNDVNSQVSKCVLFDRNSHLPETLKSQLIDRYAADLKIECAVAQTAPEKLTDGESFQEWQVIQDCLVGKDQYSNYRVQDLKTLTKVVFGKWEAGETKSFVLRDASHLDFFAEGNVHQPNGWTTYSVLMELAAH